MINEKKIFCPEIPALVKDFRLSWLIYAWKELIYFPKGESKIIIIDRGDMHLDEYPHRL